MPECKKMATLSLRSPKIITSRNRVSTPGDFPRRILPIDDCHGVISGTWLHSADVATTSHFFKRRREEGITVRPTRHGCTREVQPKIFVQHFPVYYLRHTW